MRKVIIALLCFSGLVMAKLSVVEQQLIQRHALPMEVGQIIAQKEKNILTTLGTTWPKVVEIPELPGYIIKTKLSRVEGADRIQSAIHANKLDLLTVPNKFLYHISGKPDDFTDANYLVVVRKVAAGPQFKYTFSHLMQLLSLFYNTGYVDFFADNIVPLNNKKLALIDTEAKSFRVAKDDTEYNQIFFGVLVQLRQLPFGEEVLKGVDRLIQWYNPFVKQDRKVIVDWDLIHQITKE